MAGKNKNIVVNQFQGMVDIGNSQSPNFGLETPKVILNADVTEVGSIKKRQGYQVVDSIAGAHSIWAYKDQFMLFIAAGILYRKEGEALIEITNTGVEIIVPTSYLAVDGLIYISNKYWSGIYEIDTGTISTWGLDLPDAPIVSFSSSGNLPAGTYQVAYTTFQDNKLSGNSAVSTIELSETGSIVLTDKPENAIIWMSDVNGSILYYVGSVNNLVQLPQIVEPLPSMWCEAPPKMTNLTHAFGRIWGARADSLYYSESFEYDWFKPNENVISFNGDIIGFVAQIQGFGLIIGCATQTYLLAGTTPENMTMKVVGGGVVPNSLCYISSLGEFGNNVPLWIERSGIYIAAPDGRILNVVKDKIKLNAVQDQGATISRVRDGRVHILAAYTHKLGGSGMGFGDNTTCEVIRKGSVI